MFGPLQRFAGEGVVRFIWSSRSTPNMCLLYSTMPIGLTIWSKVPSPQLLSLVIVVTEASYYVEMAPTTVSSHHSRTRNLPWSLTMTSPVCILPDSRISSGPPQRLQRVPTMRAFFFSKNALKITLQRRRRWPSKVNATMIYTLVQGSQTRGPRAACGPRGSFVRPAMLFGNFQIINIYVASALKKDAAK